MLFDGRSKCCDVDLRAFEEPRYETVGLLEQRDQEMLGLDLRMPVAESPCLRIVERLLRLLRQPVRIHFQLLDR
jgi:hypothetical protein